MSPALSSYNYTQYLMFQLQRFTLTFATAGWNEWTATLFVKDKHTVIQDSTNDILIMNDNMTSMDWMLNVSANGTRVRPEWVGMNRTLAELIMGTITFLVITVMTCVGNSLVVLSVFTYRPLKKVG